jgi:hypothetical protein
MINFHSPDNDERDLDEDFPLGDGTAETGGKARVAVNPLEE